MQQESEQSNVCSQIPAYTPPEVSPSPPPPTSPPRDDTMGCALSSLQHALPNSTRPGGLAEGDSRVGKKAKRSEGKNTAPGEAQQTVSNHVEVVKDGDSGGIGSHGKSPVNPGRVQPLLTSNESDAIGERVSLASHAVTHVGYGGLKKENQVRVFFSTPLRRGRIHRAALSSFSACPRPMRVRRKDFIGSRTRSLLPLPPPPPPPSHPHQSYPASPLLQDEVYIDECFSGDPDTKLYCVFDGHGVNGTHPPSSPPQKKKK